MVTENHGGRPQKWAGALFGGVLFSPSLSWPLSLIALSLACCLASSAHAEEMQNKSKAKPAKDFQLKPVEGGLRQVPREPKKSSRGESLWFPDWQVPGFAWTLSPIIGLSYQENSYTEPDPAGDGSVAPVTRTSRSLAFEAGARAGLSHIPIAGGGARAGGEGEDEKGGLALTVSPRGGYAYGLINELENSFQQEGQPKTEFETEDRTYHRLLAGTDVTAFYRWFRYTLGLDFARLIGDSKDGFPVTQAQMRHDLGVKLLRQVSGHVTVEVGRLGADDLSDYSLQYTDLWLHLRLNPFLKLVLDTGPGMDFYHFPSVDKGITATYLKALFDWPLFSSFGAAGYLKYVVDSDLETSSSSGTSLREPLKDLGSGSDFFALGADDLSALLFFGLRDVLPGWSVGYIMEYDVANTFERDGKRDVTSRQGLGVHLTVAL